jgi:Ca2+-binding EF-hand superfamily protein
MPAADEAAGETNVQPEATLQVTYESAVLVPGPAQDRFIEHLKRDIGVALGIDPSKVSITEITAARRRLHEAGDAVVEFTFVLTTSDETIVKTAAATLEAQLADESSALRNGAVTNQIVENQTMVWQFVCPDGKVQSRSSSVCTSCPAGEYKQISVDEASKCSICLAGTYAPAESMACVVCEPGQYDHDQLPYTVCETCAAGSFTNGTVNCNKCPTGRSSEAGSTSCELCPPRYYAYLSTGTCKLCSELPLPRRMPTDRQEVQGELAEARTCPGGRRGEQSVVVPLPGIWTHIHAGDVELLGCQSADACVTATNVTAWLAGSAVAAVKNRRHLAAQCGDGYTGFLCGECDDGFEKIDGKCIVCAAFDMHMLTWTLFLNLGMTLFIFHKSARPVVSATEIRAIWYQVDTAREGFLDLYGIGAVLLRLGASVSATKVEKLSHEMGVDAHSRVAVGDFVRVLAKSAPSQAFPTAVFFYQSLALILKQAEYFGVLDALNLDVEEAVGKCISPLRTTERFYAKVTLLPVALVLSTLVCVPLWSLLRRGLPQEMVWDRLQAPATVTPTHIKRCLLSIYLFCYSPITGSAIELLVAVKTCEFGEDCERVLDIDFGISVSSDEYWKGAAAAFATIVVFTVLVPIFLAFKARSAIKHRDMSFARRIDDVEAWFDQADADGSGALDEAEVCQVLGRMFGSATDRETQTAMRELDALGQQAPRRKWGRIWRSVNAVRRFRVAAPDAAVSTGTTPRKPTVSKAIFRRWFVAATPALPFNHPIKIYF